MTPSETPVAAILTPPESTIEVGGHSLDVSPIRLSELGAFSAAARPVFDLLRGMGDGESDAFLFDLLMHHTDEIAALVAVGARVEPDTVRGLSLDDAYTLAEAVVASNRDFFIRRVMPLLAQLARQASPGTGTMPSSPLPVPGSASETSAA